jgi:hypothetical protein
MEVCRIHQPSFTSTDATLLTTKCCVIAKFLEDHGVFRKDLAGDYPILR